MLLLKQLESNLCKAPIGLTKIYCIANKILRKGFNYENNTWVNKLYVDEKAA